MIIDDSCGYSMVYVNSRPDMESFSGIFDHLQGNLLVNPRRGQVVRMIRECSYRPLIVVGHGDEGGVYNASFNGYLFDSGMVQFLRELPCIIGCWCFAGNFADRYGLEGFFTSMFVSNVQESEFYTVPADEISIDRENRLFAERLNTLIRENPIVEEWVPALQNQADISIPFVRYNYEALAFYGKEG